MLAALILILVVLAFGLFTASAEGVCPPRGRRTELTGPPRLSKALYAVVFNVLVAGCAHRGVPERAPPPAIIAEHGIDFTLDASAAELVARYLSGADEAGAALADSRAIAFFVQKAREDEPSFSLADLQRRLLGCRQGRCSDDGGTRLTRVRTRIDVLMGFVRRLRGVQADLARDYSRQVTLYLPELGFGFRRPVYLVLGGRADAYVTFVEGEPGMVVELGSIVQDTLEDSMTMLRAAVVHELWHAVFLEYVRKHWQVANPVEVDNPDYALVFTMLNEGFGHYLSVLAFTGTEERAHSLLESRARQADGFLAGFRRKLPIYVASGADERRRLVEESARGDFFAKWGAMTGAWCVSTVIAKEGRSAAVQTLTRNPFELWERCQTAAGDTPDAQLPVGFLPLVRELAH